MGRLAPDYTPAFSRDVKRPAKRHIDLKPLKEVIDLVCTNDASSLETLRQKAWHAYSQRQLAWQPRMLYCKCGRLVADMAFK